MPITSSNDLAVLIVSGGMDSSVLAHYYASAGFDLHLLSFNYGQRHVKELSYAERTIASMRQRSPAGTRSPRKAGARMAATAR